METTRKKLAIPVAARRVALGIGLVVLAGLAYLGWKRFQPEPLPAGFASSNGRIEAVEVDVATKAAGRITSILVDEGDFVSAGQIVARMDTDVLLAQLHEAEAQLRQAKSNVEAARTTVTQREREMAAAQAVVAQREADIDAQKKHYIRIENLVGRGSATQEELDVARSSYYGMSAAVDSAKAQAAAANATVAAARVQVVGAEASVDAARAKIDRLEADIDDCVLRAPRDGRVQYRIAQPGEVLNAGGKVLNLVDLADVYMTFFLPTAVAGRIRIGAEARLVLDAAPQYVIPALVTFVADVAQFTPKTVETSEERQKLTFRVKAQIDPALLRAHIRDVKTGLPGMAYVRLDPKAPWPERLRERVPQ